MLEELIIRTLCDTLPDTPPDGAYIFAQTEDNQESIFVAAQHLLNNRFIEKVCFIKTESMSGYPGFAVWQENLLLKGVDHDKIGAVPPVPANTTILHTGIEAESLVHYAKAQGYKRMLVVAPPFHQPRAFMAAVTAALKIYPELLLYSYPGKTLPWQQQVTHSQGKVQDTRAGLVEGEINRIYKYQEMGELGATSKVLEYLNNRD